MSDQVILKTSNLTKKYGDVIVADQVNLNVRKGHIYGLLGRNGAGKTTIMKMILGLISITSGDVSVFGKPLKGNEETIYPRVGSIIETPGFYSTLSGSENLKIFARLRGTVSKTAVRDALQVAGLPVGDSKVFSNYSLGMKQRLGIANAILNDPELLILDEPTNGLDPMGIAEIRSFLSRLCHEQGKTLIISSHILSEIALLADDIGIIHHGRLLEELSMEELQKKSKKYIVLTVDCVEKAAQILESRLILRDYSITDRNTIEIYDITRPTAEINSLLVTNGIGVSSILLRNESLEDYFKDLTGGEEDAAYHTGRIF